MNRLSPNIDYLRIHSDVGESCSEDYRYTGKHEDPSGLYYFGARYYDPITGRFTTRDTEFGDLEDPQSQNRYVYCLNNPHKYTDPDGHLAITATAVFCGALAGGVISMTLYAHTSFQERKIVTPRQMAGKFTSGAIGGATTILTAGSSYAVSAIAGIASSGGGNIANSLISGEEIIPDDVAADMAMSTLTSFVQLPNPSGAGIIQNAFDETISAYQDEIVDYVNEVGDDTVDYISETYTVPYDGPEPISTINNQRIDNWW